MQFGEDISLQTKLSTNPKNVKEQPKNKKTSAKNYMPKEKFVNHIAWMHYECIMLGFLTWMTTKMWTFLMHKLYNVIFVKIVQF